MGNTTAVQSANSRRIFKTLGASFLRLKAFAWLLSQWSLSHAPCMRSLSRSGMSLRFLIGSLDYPRPVRSYAAGSVRYICYSSSTNTTFPFSRGARRGFNSKTTLSCEFLRSKDTDPYSSLLRTQVPPAQPQVSPTAHAHLCPNALLNGTSFSRTQRLDRFLVSTFAPTYSRPEPEAGSSKLVSIAPIGTFDSLSFFSFSPFHEETDGFY